MIDNEFGPVDLTGVKPDKLPRLIDLPGVKELVEAAYVAGLDTEEDEWIYPFSADYKIKLVSDYMKAFKMGD